MLLLRYLLLAASVALFGSTAALIGYDVFVALQLQRLLGRVKSPEDGTKDLFSLPGPASSTGSVAQPIRWRLGAKLASFACLALLLGVSIEVVSDGSAGVRISQISGVRPGTLYPGVHLVLPMVEHIVSYEIRDHIYATSATAVPTPTATAGTTEHKAELLTVQAREGLSMGLGVAVRYRLDPARLGYIHANVPQPVEEQVIAPVVSSIFRDVAAGYVVRDVFTVHREEFQARAAKAITERLGVDGIVVKEVVLRDVQLPAEYAKGLETMLLKEQESERMVFETEIKQKGVKIAELEAEAQKIRDIKNAESGAQVRVLQAKGEADAMQYTLPLKQKQIEQSKLEAQARKEATIENAQAAAESKVIDGKAEVERRKLEADADANTIRVTASADFDKRKLLADADANTIRVTAAANSERLNLEAAALKSNPMLIQKMIAERLSDKLQIIMVPMDGKNFFAGDVLKSAFSGTPLQQDDDPPKATTAANGKRPNQH